MSSGFGIGDVIAASKQALQTHEALKSAPKEFEGLRLEVGSLRAALQALADEEQCPTSPVHRASAARREDMRVLLSSCRRGLEELTGLVDDFGRLNGTERTSVREWLRFAARNKQGPREKLAVHTASVNMFLTTMSHGSLGRLEFLLRNANLANGMDSGGFGAFNTSTTPGSRDPNVKGGRGKARDGYFSLSSPASGVWAEIGRELADEGIRAEDAQRFREDIKAYMRYLVRGETPFWCNQNGEHTTRRAAASVRGAEDRREHGISSTRRARDDERRAREELQQRKLWADQIRAADIHRIVEAEVRRIEQNRKLSDEEKRQVRTELGRKVQAEFEAKQMAEVEREAREKKGDEDERIMEKGDSETARKKKKADERRRMEQLERDTARIYHLKEAERQGPVNNVNVSRVAASLGKLFELDFNDSNTTATPNDDASGSASWESPVGDSADPETDTDTDTTTEDEEEQDMEEEEVDEDDYEEVSEEEESENETVYITPSHSTTGTTRTPRPYSLNKNTTKPPDDSIQDARRRLSHLIGRREQSQEAGNTDSVSDLELFAIPDVMETMRTLLRGQLPKNKKPWEWPRCNPCTLPIIGTHYHCDICGAGDWDVCQQCWDHGSRCREEHHRKFELRSLDGHKLGLQTWQEKIV